MDQKRWKKIEAILDEALFLEQHEKKAFIKKACSNDNRLYKEVTALMKSIREAQENNFLENI